MGRKWWWSWNRNDDSDDDLSTNQDRIDENQKQIDALEDTKGSAAWDDNYLNSEIEVRKERIDDLQDSRNSILESENESLREKLEEAESKCQDDSDDEYEDPYRDLWGSCVNTSMDPTSFVNKQMC